MVRRYLRSLVVQAPQLQELRNVAQRAFLRAARKPFEPEFEVLRHFRPNDGECAVDIGANRGQSIDAIRLFQSTLPIVCFEPNSELSTRLEVAFEKDERVAIAGFGLSDAVSNQTLFLPYYGDYMFDGLASIDRDEATDWLNSKTLVGFDAEKLRIRELGIRLETLDDQGLKPGFIKIDVQGAEAAVIAGGAKTIDTFKPIFLVETGLNEKLVGSICDLGYEAFNFIDGSLWPRTHAVRNTIFIHPEGGRGLDTITNRAK